MKTRLIGPSELDVGAVLPQCLDVHFLSDDTYRFMSTSRTPKSYSDPEVEQRRQREAHLEYRRALIYARQTVINRAYLFNPLVYRDFEGRSDNEAGRESFKQLIKERVVVPFIMGTDIDADSKKLDASDDGRKAVESLAGVVDELWCVRLADTEEEIKTLNGKLGLMFHTFCTNLGPISGRPDDLKTLANEILGEKHSTADLEGLRVELMKLAIFALQSNQEFNRTSLYESFLVRSGTRHHEGYFFTPEERPFAFALKKIIDLDYNSNLPDLLGRFTLTPRGLPTRAAISMLDKSPSHSSEKNMVLLDEMRSRARDTVFSRIQEGFYLPDLADLTIEDVWHVRKLPEWERFADAQERILADPLNALHHLEGFADALSDFQRAFSSWAYQRYGKARRVQRYTTRVSLAVDVAGVVLLASTGENVLEILATGRVSRFIPRQVRGFVARLAVDIVDSAGVANRDLSYSIDLVRQQAKLAATDLTSLFEGYGVTLPDTANSGAPD